MPAYTSKTLEAASQSRPAARISPTSKAFVFTTLVVTLLSCLASFALSAASLLWLGAQLAIPTVVRFALPLCFDLPMLAFGMACVARRARGESIVSAVVYMVLFTAGSTAANLWHGLAATHATGAGTIAVALLAALPPVAVLTTSEQALSVIAAKPTGSREQLQAIQRVVDRGALPSQAASKGKAPRKGTPQADDLAAAVRDAAAAEPGISKTALAQRFGLSQQRVREALNAG